MIKQAVTVLLVCGMLGGCGASDKKAPSRPTPPTTSASAALLTLKEACPEAEAAMPPSDPNDPLGEASDWPSALAKLNGLQARSDTETQNALRFLITGLQAKASADNSTLDGRLAAERAMLNGVSAIALRCKAAGSSAFQ